MALKTDFKDEILSSSQPYRTYNIVDNNGETLYSNVRISKAYTPQQEGDEFGAKQINETNKAINDMIDLIYPVGALFETTNSTFDPKTSLGGTWELIEKNNPTYTITGTKVLSGNGQNWITITSVSDLQNEFYKKYGIRPGITEIGISFYNGDADATTRRVLGCDISESSKYVNVTLESSHSGSIRVNYMYVTTDTSVTVYKWKRTA